MVAVKRDNNSSKARINNIRTTSFILRRSPQDNALAYQTLGCEFMTEYVWVQSQI